MTRSKSGWLSAVVLTALAACGGGSSKDGTTPAAGGVGEGAGGGAAMVSDSAPLPGVPDQPAAEPPAVLAVVSLGDPTGQLAEFGKFADAVQPGMGAMVNIAQVMPMIAGAVGAPGLDGYAIDRPMWMVALDPKDPSGSSPLLVVGIGDEAKLKSSVTGSAEIMAHGGFAAVGSRATLRAAGPWALSNLAKSTPPRELALVVHVDRVVASHGAEVEAAFKNSVRGQPEQQVAAGASSLLRQIQTLEGTLSAGAGGLTTAGRVVPVARSGLAAFAAAQQPTDFGFAARLGGDFPLLIASRLDLSAIKGFLVALANDDKKAHIGQVFDAIGNEQVVGIGTPLGPRKIVTLRASMGLADGAKAAGLFATALEAVGKAGVQPLDGMPATLKPAPIKVKGGALHEIAFALPKDVDAGEKKAHLAAWPKGINVVLGVVGDALVVALEKDSKKGAQELAGYAGKSIKPKYGKLTADAVAAAVERKESVLVLVDAAMWAAVGRSDAPPKAGVRPPLSIGVGFDGGAVNGRLHLPIEQVTALAGGNK